jgi:2-dehydropantoate 2-reductase
MGRVASSQFSAGCVLRPRGLRDHYEERHITRFTEHSFTDIGGFGDMRNLPPPKTMPEKGKDKADVLRDLERSFDEAGKPLAPDPRFLHYQKNRKESDKRNVRALSSTARYTREKENSAAVVPPPIVPEAVKTVGLHAAAEVTQESTVERITDPPMYRMLEERHVVRKKTPKSSEVLDLIQSMESRRVHILGVGPTGRFVAHALGALGERPPVSLLFNRKDIYQRWKDEGQLLEVIRGQESDVQGGFDVERLSSTTDAISMLIVTTKPSQTVPLLRVLKDRLGPNSTICFLQSHMGITDEVTSKIFPERDRRPRYLIGFSNHLLVPSKRTFTTEQKRGGEIFLSLVAEDFHSGENPYDSKPERVSVVRKMHYQWTTSSRKLMRTLTRSTHLQVKGLQYRDLLELQLEHLAISAVVEPLCVIFDCACGGLLNNFAVTRLVQSLLEEMTSIIRSLPEFANVDALHVNEQF